jgi:hypothetical protein
VHVNIANLNVEAKEAGVRVGQIERVGVIDELVLVQHVEVHARVHALRGVSVRRRVGGEIFVEIICGDFC